jgi:NAD(P)-dependent dehydrogenase (short-subunit alcohol dehydrogenase family)
MNETIFITGVSSGLGHGLAKMYLEQGATVYGCSRRAPEDLIESGLIFKEADLSDATTACHAVGSLLADAGHIHRIILNAGKLGQIRDMQATPLSDMRETMEVNVMANKWLLDLVFASGRKVKQVVAISSGASRSGQRGWNGYSISKAALNMLIHMYANEQRRTHFTSLAPGLVDTAMQDYLTNLPADDRFKPLAILKEAKGTDEMPDGETCARQLIDIFPKLLERPSGSYADIRKL